MLLIRWFLRLVSILQVMWLVSVGNNPLSCVVESFGKKIDDEIVKEHVYACKST